MQSPGTDIVHDPDNRTDEVFKVSPFMEPMVLFWIDVYARYTSRMRVVHDRYNISMVYGIIDLTPLFRSIPPSEFLEGKVREIESAVIRELKMKVANAGGVSSRGLPSSNDGVEIKAFLAHHGAISPKRVRKLLENMRAQSGQRDMFLMALYRSTHLLPHIQNVFKQHGLPQGIARLPFVESSFNERALSRIGAVGIWQFTPDTARELIHEDKVHLWADPILQTKSAARLFRLYRSILPDWGLTITSYNAGVGRVRRLIRKYKIRSIDDLLKLPRIYDDGWGFATRNFYAEFLAANLVEEYKEEVFVPWMLPNDLSLVFREIFPFVEETCRVRG